MEKKIRKLLIVISIVSLLCSLVFGMGTIAYAETTNKVTASTSTSLTQGNSGYCYVYIDSLQNVSTLNLSVYYDSSKITITRTYNSVSCNLYDNAINTDSLNYSYVFDGNGTATQTQLFYFRFTVNSTAEVGDTYFDIVVSDAYDSALNEIEIRGSRTAFAITEKVVSKTAYIYGTSSVYTSVEQEFELTYRFNTRQIASGSAVITYDSELFEVVSVTENYFLNNMVTDINTELRGSIYVSFVGTEYASNTSFVTVRFKTLQNTTTNSSVKISAADLYDLDLNYISCSYQTTTVYVSYDDSYVQDASQMSLSNSYDEQKGQLTVQIDLEANSHLGAGDFVVRFDTSYLAYISSTKGFSPSFFNINDKDVENGVIKFSIISLEDIVESQKVMTIVFDVLNHCTDAQTAITIDGNNLYDSSTEKIVKINFIDTSFTVPGKHNIVQHEAKAPTCTEVGWNAYENCSRCEYTTYVELSALGHEEIEHDAQSVSCTDIGWDAYITCSRCDYSSYNYKAI